MKNESLEPSAAAERNGRDALEQLIRAAGRRPVPNAEDFERVRLASHLAWQMKVHAVRRRRTVWYALAASVVGAALGTFTFLQDAPPPDVAEVTLVRGRVERLGPGVDRWEPLAAAQTLAAGTELRASDDGGAAFRLPDGISLRVAAGTTLTLVTAQRLALEAGSIYVDTGASAGGGGIEIATAHGTVHDVGTQFELRSYSSELRVRVREGRVQVVTAAPAPHETPAGEELRLTADGTAARASIATDGDDWLWAEALAAPVDIDGGTAFEVLQWVARETGKQLIFADVNTEIVARNAVIHGSSAGLEPLQILEVVLATSAELDCVIGDGTLIIRRR